MLLDDFIITVYCFVDDFLKNYEKLRARGPSPALSDAEVLTMEIVGEFLKQHSKFIKINNKLTLTFMDKI